MALVPDGLSNRQLSKTSLVLPAHDLWAPRHQAASPTLVFSLLHQLQWLLQEGSLIYSLSQGHQPLVSPLPLTPQPLSSLSQLHQQGRYVKYQV